LLKAGQSEALLIHRRLAYRRYTGQGDCVVIHTAQKGKFLQHPTIEILNRTLRYEDYIDQEMTQQSYTLVTLIATRYSCVQGVSRAI
jgi:esterase/lipase superfamily enzyme